MEVVKDKVKRYFVAKAGNRLGQIQAKQYVESLQVPYDCFANQSLRTLSFASVGASEVGEVLSIQSQMAESLPFDDMRIKWYTLWHDIASQTEKDADKSAEAGHFVSAASAHLRAAEYHRQSSFFLREDITDNRLIQAVKASTSCFLKHVKEAQLNIQQVDVPCSGGSPLFGYYCCCQPNDNSNKNNESKSKKRATIIMPGGYDGSTEEVYYSCGQAAIKRGYNVLIIDGPGQGNTAVLRNRLFGTHSSDYKNVMIAAVEWLKENKGEDTDFTKLTLVARSFGGFLGVKMAAATLPNDNNNNVNLAAVALDPMQVDFKSAVGPKMMLPPGGLELLKEKRYEELDVLYKPCLEQMPLIRFQLMSRAAFHGLSHSPAEYLGTMYHDFSAFDDLGEIPVQTAVWTSANSNEKVSVAAGRDGAVKEKLGGGGGRLTVHEFEQNRDGSLGHCEGGGTARFTEVMFDWLDEQVKPLMM
jgi:pimeloyl-ACP methyl ester carboxylesterase